MGLLIKNACMNVAVIGADEDLNRKLSNNFKATDTYNPGSCIIASHANINAFLSSGSIKKVNSICIVVDPIPPEELTCFIAKTRVIEPLVSFCLIGRKEFLEDFPKFHPEWKIKFSHYYKLHINQSEIDFDENTKIIRDLFLADTIKRAGLGRYDTVPGATIIIKHRPWGFWIIIVVSLIAAMIGGISGPIYKKAFTANDQNTDQNSRKHEAGVKTPTRNQ